MKLLSQGILSGFDKKNPSKQSQLFKISLPGLQVKHYVSLEHVLHYFKHSPHSS